MRQLHLTIRNLSLLLGLCLLFSFKTFHGDDPWTPQQLMDPAQLAKILNDPKAKKPAIFNVGPMSNIKSAVYIGSTASSAELEKFKREVAKLPKDKSIVIYCGCCSSKDCPNIRPAFEFLNVAGYTEHKVLNLPVGLSEDWQGKGYPMEQ